MKILILYIDGKKCEFKNGFMAVTISEPAEVAPWFDKNRKEIERYKNTTAPDSKEQQQFINRCDPDLLDEVYESMMIPEELDFNDFYFKYQNLHFLKYHEDLNF